MIDIRPLLEISSRDHQHICPRQILGVRIGLAGACALGFQGPIPSKQLLVIAETDGCFVDGVSAATGCTVGHRTLRIEDYGKIAATFVEVRTGRAVRVAPVPDARERARRFAQHEPRHYFAQMEGYQIMPTGELLMIREVALRTPVADIVSRVGLRVACKACGEEIINEREVVREGLVLCRACAGAGYYEEAEPVRLGAHCSMSMTLNAVP
jgi:formylmethanofuran dehydrogenase subunit E